MQIKFGDFKLSKEAREAVLKVLDSNNLAQGLDVKEFELNYANHFGYKKSRMVSSGTAGDTSCCMALYELGAKQGDEIITSALSFIATGNSIRMAGFTPVFVDIDHDLLMRPDLVEKAITPRTKAIIAVTLMGRSYNLEALSDIARRHNLYLIIDNCEGVGGKFKNKTPLEYGDMEVISMFVAHCLMTGMEGGVVSTNNDEIDMLIEAIRSHGRMKGSLYFHHPIFGTNAKANNLAAVIANENLKILDQTIEKRRRNIFSVLELCDQYEDVAWYTGEKKDEFLSPHAFSITLKPKYKDKLPLLKETLDKAEIEWKRNFGAMPLHGTFSYLGLDQNHGFYNRLDAFPIAEYVGNIGIHFGVHHYLSEEDIEYIKETLTIFFKSIK